MSQVKNIPEVAATKRPWWRLGTGTILAIFIGAAVVYGQSARTADQNGGRITYEADANGHLRPVASSSLENRPQTPPPLWKPEVRLLLERRQDLHLAATQSASLRKLDSAWVREKADWLKRLGETTGNADVLLRRASPRHGVSLSAVRSRLEEYSRLSEAYDECREGYWTQATGLLTSLQRQQLDRIPCALNTK